MLLCGLKGVHVLTFSILSLCFNAQPMIADRLLQKVVAVISEQPHLVLLVGLALFVAYAQLIGGFNLLYHHHLQAGTCQPLGMLVVVLLREAAMGLLTLPHTDASLPRAVLGYKG